MDLEESYHRLTERKRAAGFDPVVAQEVTPEVMRLICIGLEIEIEDLVGFARTYVRGLIGSGAAAVSYGGLVGMEPELVVGLILDMVALGAFHHEQARREVE